MSSPGRNSPGKNAGSPSKSPQKTPKSVTRYGTVHQRAERFGKEERFRWQKAQNTSDVAYVVPVEQTSKDIRFPLSTRKPLNTAEQFSTGPGSVRSPEFTYSFLK